jgi:hypothetical protein
MVRDLSPFGMVEGDVDLEGVAMFKFDRAGQRRELEIADMGPP